jgi:hypothetical protein
MDPMLARLLILAAANAVSVGGVLLVRRRVPYHVLAQNQAFTGVTYTIVGAVYGVYLAFTIVVVWQQFDQAEQNATAEAVHLSEAWRDVQVLPPAPRHVMEERLLSYADAVVHREWPSMAARQGADAETARLYEEVWNGLYAVRAQASLPGDAMFFSEAVREMNTIGVQRRMRLLASDSRLPTIMWILLIGGGIVTVGFTYFVGTTHSWLQIGVTAALTGLVVFSLLLVAALQHPFEGDISVKPAAYEGLIQSFRDRLQHEASTP